MISKLDHAVIDSARNGGSTRTIRFDDIHQASRMAGIALSLHDYGSGHALDLDDRIEVFGISMRGNWHIVITWESR